MRRVFDARVMFAVAAVFIFYATTMPWDLAGAPQFDRVNWIPGWDSERGRIWSIPDMVQNVVLFMPYGFLAVFALKRLKTGGIIFAALGAGLLGGALSLFVECLQTMSPSRSPSATDLATNFGGACIGGFTAAFYLRRLHEKTSAKLDEVLKDRPGLLITSLYLAAITLGSLAPFLPSLDYGLLRSSVRGFLDHPWGVKPVGALITDGLLFAALSFLVAHEIPAFLGSKPWFRFFKKKISAAAGAGFAIAFTICLACALELCQLFIRGHSPGVQDAVIGSAGAIVGAIVAAALSGGSFKIARRLGALSRRTPWIVLGFGVLAPIVRALQPFEFVPLEVKLAGVTIWNVVPFYSLFQKVNVSTFRNVFEAASFYLPLGYGLHAYGKSVRFGVVACVVLSAVLEIAQLTVIERVSDITECIYAGLMGLFGAFAYQELTKRTTRARTTRPS